MKKPKLYKGGDLKGTWLFTTKLDGVRMLRDGDGNPVSRNGKPLHNLNNIPLSITDAEVFLGNWESTVSAVRTLSGEEVSIDDIYSIEPIDPRLKIALVEDPEEATIISTFEDAKAKGHEGLVLHHMDSEKCLKVKGTENYDVMVLGSTKGKGKFEGLIGALITEKGNVSGFDDTTRKRFTDTLPEMIEVECMELTPKGNFRHPRFIRERFDK